MRTIRIIFRLIFAAGCGYGIWLQMSAAPSPILLLTYYTLQSNIICLALTLILLVRDLLGKDNDGRWYPVVKGACVMCILLTFFVYHFMLRPTMFAMANYSPGNLPDVLVHYFTPLVMLADYLIFDRKGRYTFTDPLRWTAIPLFYIAFTYIYVALGGGYAFIGGYRSQFPYFFMDYIENGVGATVLTLLVMTAVYIAAGYLIVLLDRLLCRLSGAHKV